MTLSPGTRLGPYEIQAAIGAGGMGEVYKAKDTRLDRSVAIKILPPEFSADSDRRARFEREAKTIAGLNHPHICTLHDVGEHPSTGSGQAALYLVMEYLAGETLATRLEKGPLPLEQALTIATEIAEALAAAHRQGIIHRDLKPANVMLTKGGVVRQGSAQTKLLDFGLAKLKGHGEQPAAGQVASAPTRSRPLTAEGAIVGTLQYMAPEQVEGRPADARTDLWALGAILYEMLTGKRAFEGASAASLIAAILEHEPAPVPTLQPLTPPALDRLVRHCLAKSPDDRPDTAHDVANDLRWIRETSDSATVAGVPRPPRRRWRSVAIGIGGTGILAALIVWLMRQPPPDDFAAAPLTTYSGVESQPSFSPDGNKVAFVWNGDKEDNPDIYVKQIGAQGSPVRLTTSPAEEAYPAWSPDDRWVAFTRNQPDQGNVAVLLIPPLGGPERKLTEMIAVAGLCWTPDGKWVVFSERDSEERASIWAVSIETRERRRLTTFLTTALATEGDALGDRHPSISPDGRSLAFARQEEGFLCHLDVLPLTRDLRPAGEPRRATGQDYAQISGVAWSASSREVVYAAGSLGVQSLWRVSVVGQGTPKRMPFATPSASYPAITHKTSRLAYSWGLLNVNIWRLDTRTGERRMLIGSTYDSRIPQYSPDGRRIAFQSNRSGSIEVWTCDADGLNCFQLTSFGGPQCGTPRWSPDGRSIVLDSRVEGWSVVYVISADGGTPRQFTNATRCHNTRPSWSPDGRWIYFTSDRSGRQEIWKMPVGGGQAAQVTRSGGVAALSSPDGKYIYYVKEPGPAGLFRMPADGGEEEQVAQARVFWVNFGVTAKGVYFPTGGTLQFFDTATGKVTALAAMTPTGGLSVSPDDRYVIWAQVDRNTNDLMLVERFR